jgi:hypothetical protein
LTASRVFIGDLRPGESINVTFVVDVDPGTAPGKYPLVFLMVWNQTGSLYPLTESAVAYVNVANSLNTLLYVVLALVVIVIVIGALAGLRMRRRGGGGGV